MKAILRLKVLDSIMSSVEKQPSLIGMFFNEYEQLHDSIPSDAEPDTCTKHQNLFACVTTLHHAVIFDNESLLLEWNRIKKYYKLSMSERLLIDMFCHIPRTSKYNESVQMLFDITIYYLYYKKSFDWFKNSIYLIIAYNQKLDLDE